MLAVAVGRVRGRTVAVGGAVSVAVAVGTAVALAVALAVTVAEAVGSGVEAEPVGSGCVSGGGAVAVGVHAASTAGVSIAALITERTTSLMGERPWYDISQVYTEETTGKRRFGGPSSGVHSTKGSTAA